MNPQKTRFSKLIYFFSIITIMSIVSGCSLYRIDSANLSDDVYMPKESPHDVQYLKDISRSYKVIATVTVNTERIQDIDSVIEKMKREAAILGGDAITNLRTNAGTGRWAQIKPKKLFGNANVRVNVLCDVVVFE